MRLPRGNAARQWVPARPAEQSGGPPRPPRRRRHSVGRTCRVAARLPGRARGVRRLAPLRTESRALRPGAPRLRIQLAGLALQPVLSPADHDMDDDAAAGPRDVHVLEDEKTAAAHVGTALRARGAATSASPSCASRKATRIMSGVNCRLWRRRIWLAALATMMPDAVGPPLCEGRDPLQIREPDGGAEHAGHLLDRLDQPQLQVVRDVAWRVFVAGFSNSSRSSGSWPAVSRGSRPPRATARSVRFP
jgi:hypothetical protein